ncbi:hypothetical protein LLG46_10925 [bacterium]|nr:hypothetical protein [bacterium]
MSRSYTRLFLCVLSIFMLMAMVVPCQSMSVYWPKPDQIVRENVKISVPGSSVPKDSFISVLVGEVGKENFVLAVDSESVRAKNGTINILWNSKSPYRTVSNPKDDHYFKDGKYNIKIEVHKQSKTSSSIMDTASVPIVLKNKIARPNPAPGINLVNRLSFGQMNTYKIRSDVQVFEVVSGIALPIVGGLGMSGEFKVVQSVEDVRNTGDYLLRYRIDGTPYVTQFGQRMKLYEFDQIKPQLYRVMDKYGNVIDRNMFSKQAQFKITDILPVLPKHAVKEGDSWPDSMSIKLDGLTDAIYLKGTCSLDSFEWQSGRECVKLISKMSGKSTIALIDGKIRSSDDVVNADVVTYFDYKNGKTIRRDVTLEFRVIVEPGAGDVSLSGGVPQASSTGGFYHSASPVSNQGFDQPGPPSMNGNISNSTAGYKKGKVQITSSIVLAS